jgi:hypothetical protein
MKKIIILAAVMFVAGVGFNAQAQDNLQEVSGYIGGGLSSLRYKPEIGKRNGGAGFNLGAGYTYYWLNSTVAESGLVYQTKWGVHSGIGINFCNAKTKINDRTTMSNGLIDDENEPFDMETTLSDYKETQRAFLLTIPVMGVLHFDKYYAMGGFKFGIPLSKKYKSKDATLKNSAYYPELDNWLETQTFAGLGEFKGVDSNGKLKLGVSTMLAIEGGMRWRIRANHYVDAGIFFECGLNSINKDSDKPFIYDNENGNKIITDKFSTNSILSTSMVDKVKMMAFGVKVRYAFELK